MRSPRRLVILAGVTGLLLLGAFFYHLGLDRSDKVGSVLGAFYGGIGLITLAYAAIDRKPAAEPSDRRGTRRLLLTLIAVLSLALAAVVAVPLLTRHHDGGSTDQARQQQPSNTPTNPAAPGSSSTSPSTSIGQQQPDTNQSQPTGQPRPSGVVPPLQNPTNTQNTTPVPPPPQRAPWEPPAGTPEWTMHHTDAVNFSDPPRFQTAAGSGDLTFQADTHQINWWQWTDSLDLSPAGCRNRQSDHWDAIKLDLFDTPRVYCREDPENPNRVEYIQFTAKDMTAAPQYVKVKAWVVTG